MKAFFVRPEMDNDGDIYWAKSPENAEKQARRRFMVADGELAVVEEAPQFDGRPRHLRNIDWYNAGYLTDCDWCGNRTDCLQYVGDGVCCEECIDETLERLSVTLCGWGQEGE